MSSRYRYFYLYLYIYTGICKSCSCLKVSCPHSNRPTHSFSQTSSIMHARWPEVGEVDEKLIRTSQYLTDAAHEFRVRLKAALQPKGKVGPAGWIFRFMVIHTFAICRWKMNIFIYNFLDEISEWVPNKPTYCQTSNIRCTLVGNEIVDHSDVVGASPVGAAPTTSSFPTYRYCKMRRETFKHRDLVRLT